jgi:hypothetical protein
MSQHSFFVGHRHAISAKLYFHPLHVEHVSTGTNGTGTGAITRLKSTLCGEPALLDTDAGADGGVDAEKPYVANLESRC